MMTSPGEKKSGKTVTTRRNEIMEYLNQTKSEIPDAEIDEKLRNGSHTIRPCSVNLELLSMSSVSKRLRDGVMYNNITCKPHSVKKFKALHNLETEFVVEKILEVDWVRGCKKLLVKWKGYSDSQNTYESLKNLTKCTKLLEEFIAKERARLGALVTMFLNDITADEMFSTASLEKMLENKVNLQYNAIDLETDIILWADIKRAPNKKTSEKIKTQLQKKVLKEKLANIKLRLTNWETEVNRIEYRAKINILNEVDLEGPPCNFNYITESFSGIDVPEIPHDPPTFCTCTTLTSTCKPSSNKCCGHINQSEFAYNSHKRLKDVNALVYECNRNCSCGPDCTNRVIQHGCSQALTIFRTESGCGWGVKTHRSLKYGTFICEYVGEIITHEEAEKRGSLYDQNGCTYLFDLDVDDTDGYPFYTIDASKAGNISRFINHSCEPNLTVVSAWIDCLDINLPRLALFSNRLIEKGEQLTIDYKMSVPTSPSKELTVQNKLENELEPEILHSSLEGFSVPSSPRRTLFNSRFASIPGGLDGTINNRLSNVENGVKDTDILIQSDRVNNNDDHKTINGKKCNPFLFESIPIYNSSDNPINLTVIENATTLTSKTSHKRKRVLCACGTAKCRKYLF